mgnify:FL=1
MWLVFAFASAIFAGFTTILAKIGVKNIDSNVATAIRTVIIVIFAFFMTFITKGYESELTSKSLTFLILSRISTGLSWLCYFKALQTGDVNKVAPIDKSSTVLTMILAFIFLNEQLTLTKIAGMIMIGAGTYFMIEKKENVGNKNIKKNSWLIYAVLSAVFAALTSILGKVGITGIESNYGTAIRSVVVLVMAWIVVFTAKKQIEVKNIDKKTFIFLVLSGITTGLSWLTMYRALQDGQASVVVAIDKLSILFTVAFSYVAFKEKLNIKSFAGLIGITVGTLILLI